MTRKQQMVLDYLRTNNNAFLSPKTINVALGFSPRGSWVSKILKSLVSMNLVERSAKGQYKVVTAAPVEQTVKAS